MNRIKSLLITLLLIFSSANALEMGQITLNSRLDQPLHASFTLSNIPADSLGDIILSLADQKTYESMGLEKPYYLSKLKFKVIEGEGNQHVVQISTQKRVREPIIDILITVTEKQSSLTRHYSLMLDPPDYAHDETIQQVESDKLVKLVETAKKTARLPALPISTEQIIVNNMSISIIAQNSPLHKNYSVYQIMRAFYLLNTQAFLKGNINRIISGSILQVPPESLVKELSRQKSINFVLSVSKNNPNVKAPKARIADSDIPESKIVKPDNIIKKSNTVPLLKQDITNKTPDKNVNSTKTVEFPEKLQQKMQQDINEWRDVSKEFKSLSSVVQKQNSAIMVQTSLIQKINDLLEEKNQQIELINIRLEALERSTLSAVPEQNESISTNSSLTVSDNRLMIQQGQVISEKLATNLDEISRIKHRLEALEKPVKKPVESIASISNSALPVNQSQEVSTSWFSQNSSAILWGAILFIITILIMVIRELQWRRKLKPVITQKQDQVSETQLTPEETVDIEIERTEEVPVHSSFDEHIEPEQLQESTHISNIDLADLKFEEAMNQVKELKPAEVSTHKEAVPDDHKEVYGEIDILMAYQLYDEAFEMISSLKQKHEGEPCLQIRELELLGYTQNSDLFFAQFEQLKDTLSLEYPEEWEKIEKLNEKLTLEQTPASNVLSLKTN